MDNHLKLLEQETSKVESKKEKGETSNKRKRGVERDGCGEWPVIIVDSDNDKPEAKHQEGAGGKEEEEESAEEDESEEDEETDGNSERDVNSDSETESEKEAVVDSDEALESIGDSFDDDDDDDTKSDSAFGNQHKETSEDSSMFRMKVSD